MFERANTVLPIIPSIELNGINYEYYNHAIFSSATFEKSGSNPALVQFASKYQQELLPWAPASNQLYYDTASGQQPYPAVWATFFESQAGKIELAQQLAEALELLNLGTNVTTPADFIEAGITYPNETFLQWADRVDLPAYSGISDTWWYAALSLLPEPLPAAIRLDMDQTAIGGLIRNAFLALGVTEAARDWICQMARYNQAYQVVSRLAFK